MKKRLGRQPRKFNALIPHYSALRFSSAERYMQSIAPIPDSYDYTKGMPDNFGMMLNNSLGCCTIAAYYHARQIWTFDANGSEITEPDSNILAMYEQADGYVDGNPDTDNGGVMQDVLTYLLNTGAPVGIGLRNKINAFMEVNPTNLDSLRHVIYDSGCAYIGVNLPQSAEQGMTWDVGGDETIAGRHCVILTGYNPDGFTAISWGQRYSVTNAFIEKFNEEAYAIVDPTFIVASGTTPLGMTLQELEDAMQGLKQ